MPPPAGPASTAIHGTVAGGFEPVREAFRENFQLRGELGAACTIFQDGRKVVDLWGGIADRAAGTPWREDSLVLVYSLTKGMTAAACAVAVSLGRFHYDQPVAEIWPEFAAHGKDAVTIRELLSGQAGLGALDHPLDFALMGDQDAMAGIIARQVPNWRPGDWSGNQGYVIGWLASELIRRTDPQHRTLGKFFQDEVARPLGAEFHLGLPADFPVARLARIAGFPGWRMLFHFDTLPPALICAMLAPWSLSSRTLNNPAFARGPGALDQPAHWRIEDGGAGGLGSARALATVYSEFATGGGRLRLRPEVLEQLAGPAPRPRRGYRDQVLKADVHYSHGFEKSGGVIDFDGTPGAFGTFALGGSFAFASPARRVGYAYVTNRLAVRFWNDPREQAVRRAFLACAAKLSG